MHIIYLLVHGARLRRANASPMCFEMAEIYIEFTCMEPAREIIRVYLRAD